MIQRIVVWCLRVSVHVCEPSRSAAAAGRGCCGGEWGEGGGVKCFVARGGMMYDDMLTPTGLYSLPTQRGLVHVYREC